MVKKIKRISKPVKQKFTPGFLYLIFSLVALILVVVFLNTSKISKEPKASAPNTRLKTSSKNVKVTIVKNVESDCKNLYPTRRYSSCEYGVCGTKGIASPPFYIKTNLGQKCGTYTTYTNSFPWNLWDRTKVTKNMYCCYSDN